jgi:hypothetical protein
MCNMSSNVTNALLSLTSSVLPLTLAREETLRATNNLYQSNARNTSHDCEVRASCARELRTCFSVATTERKVQQKTQKFETFLIRSYF